MFEALAGDDPPWHEEPAAPPGAIAADRLLVRLARAQTDQDAVAAVFNARIDALTDARDMAMLDIGKRIGWIETALSLYHQARYREDPSQITIKLPHGTLSSRKAQPRWEFDDDFIVWAQTNAEEALRVTTEVAKNPAKQLLGGYSMKDDGRLMSPDGELVPGVRVFPGDGRNYSQKTGVG